MQLLDPTQYALARPIFHPLTDVHLSLAATLAGSAPGRVWLDNLDQPRIGYAISPEGHYLAGDPEQAASHDALKETIEHDAYLVVDPAEWASVRDRIWSNQVAQPHERCHLRFQQQRLADWRARLPAEFEFVRVDAEFLQRSQLKNHDGVTRWITGWHSTADFLANGLGFCIVAGDTIASMSIMDCRWGETCEIGIRTDMTFRRRGLAALVVAGMVDACLAQGITTIGWHCLRTNIGSRRTAEKVGFAHVADYVAYSSFFPAQNPGDLSPAAAANWASHFDWAIAIDPQYRLDAAAAWALAGESTAALAHLRHVAANQTDDRLLPWLETAWVFASLRDLPEFQAVCAQVRDKRG